MTKAVVQALCEERNTVKRQRWDNLTERENNILIILVLNEDRMVSSDSEKSWIEAISNLDEDLENNAFNIFFLNDNCFKLFYLNIQCKL